MTAFLARRGLMSVLVLVGVLTVVFIVTRTFADPARLLTPIDATEAQYRAMRAALGLDDPLVVQYGRFMGQAVRGDLGDSYWQRAPVIDLVAQRLPATLAHALEQSQLDPGLLTLEITEGALMQNAAATVRTLTLLRELGVHLAVDDFGTGYSSLAYLQQFPVHALKVDRSFVEQLDKRKPEAEASAAIIRAIVNLAVGLDLQTVAEGIETPDQLAAVTDLGCDLGQGFFLGRPAPPDAIALAAPSGVVLPAAFTTVAAGL